MKNLQEANKFLAGFILLYNNFDKTLKVLAKNSI